MAGLADSRQLLHSREKQADQNGDDGDDNEKFHKKRETKSVLVTLQSNAPDAGF